MSNTSHPSNISLSAPHEISEFLASLGVDPNQIEVIASDCGWQTRVPRKITAPALVTALCKKTRGGTPSYNDIASAINDSLELQPSRQAVSQRLTKPCLEMIQNILRIAIEKRMADSTPQIENKDSILSQFNQVKVQDSSVVKLPSWLFDSYSGVANGSNQVCNARIQAVYDLKRMAFLEFSIDAYSKNDLAAAPELKILKVY